MKPNITYELSVFTLLFLIWSIILYFLSLDQEKKYRKIFFYGAIFKLVFALLLGFVFLFYYKWGDTLTFWEYGELARNIIDKDFTQFVNIIIKGNHSQYSELAKHPLVSNQSFILMKNISAILSYISFDSYLGMGIYTSLFSFAGSWFLYKRLCKIYKSAYRGLGIVLFFVPSIAFWTSGLLKDTIVLGCFTFFIGAMLDLVKIKRRRLQSILIMYLAYYVIHIIKSYVADALLLSAILYIVYNSLLNIPSKLSRNLLYGFSFICFIAILLVFNAQISSYVQQALIEEFISEAMGKQNMLNYVGDQSASSYQLGLDLYQTANISMVTVLQLFPMAVATTLFRPFVWEAHKAIVMISAIENLAILGVTVYVILKVGVLNFFKIIFDDSFLTFLFIFVLIFAFAVGLATGNFGALSRYRTPGMALYFPLLYLVYYKYQIQKNEKRLYR